MGASMASVVGRWRTGLKGRANRGRMFWPGMSADLELSGFWDNVAQNAISSSMSLLFDGLGPSGTPGLVLSVMHRGGPPPPSRITGRTPVTAFDIDNVIRSQRR